MTIHTHSSTEQSTHLSSEQAEGNEHLRARVQHIQDQVRSVVYTALQHDHEVAESVPTIAEITDTLSSLDAAEQQDYLIHVLSELPDAENYSAIRYFASQSLSLYQQQAELEATESEDEKREKLTEMIDQALRNLRKNPDTLAQEVTHGSATMTIGELISLLQNAKQDLENGARVADVEESLRV